MPASLAALRLSLAAGLLAVVLAAPLAGPAAAEENDGLADAVVSPLRFAADSGLVVAEARVALSLGRQERSWVIAAPGPSAVTTLFALALPRLDAATASLDGLVRRPGADFLGLALAIDGRPLAATIDSRASRLGVDLTERLKADGVPVDPWTTANVEKALAAVAPERRPFYAERGLVVWDGDAVGRFGWDVDTTLSWTATVPAGGRVTVTEAHVPTVGTALLSAVGLERLLARPDCRPDAATAAALKKALAPAKGAATTTASMSRRLRVALADPGRPAVPLGRLAVTLETPTATTLVVACGPLAGRRTGPTTVVFEATAITPTADLDLLLIDPATP